MNWLSSQSVLSSVLLYVLVWTSSVSTLAYAKPTAEPPPSSPAESTPPQDTYELSAQRITSALNNNYGNEDLDEFRLINADVLQDGIPLPYEKTHAASAELSPELTYTITPLGDVEVRHPHLQDTVLLYKGVHAAEILEVGGNVLVFVTKTDLAQKLIHNKPLDSDRILGFYWFKKETATRFPLSPFAWHFYRFPDSIELHESDYSQLRPGKIKHSYNRVHQAITIRRSHWDETEASGIRHFAHGRFQLDTRLMAIKHFTTQVTLLGIALVHRHDLGHLNQLRDHLQHIQQAATQLDEKLRDGRIPDTQTQALENLRTTVHELKTQTSPQGLFGARAIQKATALGFHDPGRYALAFKAVKELSDTLDTALLAETLDLFAGMDQLNGSLENIMLQGSSGNRTVAGEAQAGLKQWKKEKFPIGGLVGMIAVVSLGVAIAGKNVFASFYQNWDGYLSHSLGQAGFWQEMAHLCLINVMVLGIVMGIGYSLGLVTKIPLIRRSFPSLYFVQVSDVGHLRAFEINGSRFFQYVNYWLNSVWRNVVPTGLQRRLEVGLVHAFPEDAKFVEDFRTSLGGGEIPRAKLTEKRHQMEQQFAADKIKIMAFYQQLVDEDIQIREENRPRILLMLEAFMGSNAQLKPQTDEHLKIYQYLCVRTMELDGQGYQDGTEVTHAQLMTYQSLFHRAKLYAEKMSKPIATLISNTFKPSLGSLAVQGTFLLTTVAVLADWIPTVTAQIAVKGWGNPLPWVEPIYAAGAGFSSVLFSYDIFQWILGFAMDFSLFGMYVSTIDDVVIDKKTGILERFSKLFQSKLFDNGKFSLSKTFSGAYRTYLAIFPIRMIALSTAMAITGKWANPLVADYVLHYFLIAAPLLSLTYYVLFDTAIKAITGNTQQYSKLKRLGIVALTGVTYGFVSSSIGEWSRTRQFFQYHDAAGTLIPDKYGRPQLALDFLHSSFWQGITDTLSNVAHLNFADLSYGHLANTVALLGAATLITYSALKIRRQHQEIQAIYQHSRALKCH